MLIQLQNPTETAKNTLEDGFDASPALVDNQIFMRGYKYLYCIAGS